MNGRQPKDSGKGRRTVLLGAPLYLRDLKKELRDDFTDRWKKDNQKELLQAVKDEEDIQIGWYTENAEIVG